MKLPVLRCGWALAALAALAGCAMSPSRPAPVPQAVVDPAHPSFSLSDGALVSQDKLPPRWWQLYADPALNTLVESALSANSDIRVAEANLRRAAAFVQEARAGRKPTTTVSASAAATKVGGFTRDAAHGLGYDLGFGVSYPLDLGGGIRQGIAAATADREAAEASRDQARVLVAAAMTRAYLAVCAANRSIAATQQVLDVQQETLQVTRTLAEAGRGTDFDVSRARAAANQSQAQLPALRARRQAALFEIAALMGRPATAYPGDVADCPRPPELLRPLPVGDGVQLLRRRPDVRQAERQLAAAHALVAVEQADLYPQIALGGSLGVAGPHAAPAFGGSLGPLITWRFPNRHVARARIAQAGANADAALASLDGTVVQALSAIETALSAYAQEIERTGSLKRARDDAALASRQANTLFTFGRIGFIDVLTSEATLADAETRWAAAQAELDATRIDVFLALGGGWEQ